MCFYVKICIYLKVRALVINNFVMEQLAEDQDLPADLLETEVNDYPAIIAVTFDHQEVIRIAAQTTQIIHEVVWAGVSYPQY